MGPTQGAVAGLRRRRPHRPRAARRHAARRQRPRATSRSASSPASPSTRAIAPLPIMIGIVGLRGRRRPGTAALDTLLGSDRVAWERDAGHGAEQRAVRRGPGPVVVLGVRLAGPPGDARGARRLIIARNIPVITPQSRASGTGRPARTSYRHTWSARRTALRRAAGPCAADAEGSTPVSERSNLRLLVLGVLVALAAGHPGRPRRSTSRSSTAPTYRAAAADNTVREVVDPGDARPDPRPGRAPARLQPHLARRDASTAASSRSRRTTARPSSRASPRSSTPRRAKISDRLELCGTEGAKPPPVCWNGSPVPADPGGQGRRPQTARSRSWSGARDFPGVSASLEAVREYPRRST